MSHWVTGIPPTVYLHQHDFQRSSYFHYSNMDALLFSEQPFSLLGYFTLKSHPGDLQGTDNSVFHVALEVRESAFPFVLKLRSYALKEKKQKTWWEG